MLSPKSKKPKIPGELSEADLDKVVGGRNVVVPPVSKRRRPICCPG